MGLLDILKGVLGLGGSESGSRSGTADAGRQDVDVTIEHDPTPDTESETAVKGTDGAAVEAGTATEGATGAEPSVREGETADPETAAGVPEPESTEGEEEPAAKETAETTESEAEAEAGTGSSPGVESIKGIGPSYADSLSEAGVGTVADLADADPEEVADRTGISEKRVSRWVSRVRGEE